MYKHTHTRSRTHKCSASFFNFIVRRSCYEKILYGHFWYSLHRNRRSRHQQQLQPSYRRRRKKQQTEANIVCIRLHMVKRFGLAIFCNGEKKSPQICSHSQCSFHVLTFRINHMDKAKKNTYTHNQPVRPMHNRP